MPYFMRSVNKLTHWASLIAGIALGVSVLITCVDVVGRYFGHPVLGSVEIVEISILVCMGFAIAYTQSQRGHIAIDFLVSRFPQRVQVVIDIITCFISVCFWLLVAWQVIKLGNDKWHVGQVTETLLLPFAPFLYALAFGCILTCAVLIADLYNLLTKSTRGQG